MQFFALKSSLVQPGDSVTARLFEALSRMDLVIENGDIVAVASKIVSIAEKNTLGLGQVKPTRLAKKLGHRLALPPDFVQTVIDEADTVYDGVPGVVLTIRNGNATANSGVDRKNALPGTVILWPPDPHRSAERIRRAIRKRLEKNVGVVIVDSRITPLRLGTIGLAIGCSGFEPVKDERGLKDLYGRRVSITFQAIADGIAAGAHLLMGETRETVPFVLVRDAPVRLGNRAGLARMTLPVKDCIYMSQLSHPSLGAEVR